MRTSIGTPTKRLSWEDVQAQAIRRLAQRRLAARPQATPENPLAATITTDDALWQYVWDTWGVAIPRVAVCPGHVAPFTAFADAFFARHSMAVWKGSRGLAGKSFLLSVLGRTMAVVLRANVVILGGSLKQSMNVHRYMREGWDAANAPRHLLVSDPSTTKTMLSTGNEVEAITASQNSVRGPHPERLLLDECLASGTPILTVHGLRAIASLCVGDKVYSYGEGHIRVNRILAKHCRGFRATVRIETRHGAFYATPDHPLLAASHQWIKAQEAQTEGAVRGLRCLDSFRQAGSTPSMYDLLQGIRLHSPSAGVCLWTLQESAIAGMRTMLSGGTCCSCLPLCRLSGSLTTKDDCALQSVSSALDEPARTRTHGGITRNGIRIAGQQGRDCGARVAGCVGDCMETTSSYQVVADRFVCGAEYCYRDPWGLLARQARAYSPRSEADSGINRHGISRHYSETGRDAFMVEDIAILSVTPGPVLLVWDLNVERDHNYISAGVISHNCDEMKLSLFDAAMGQTLAKPGIPAGTVASSTHQHPNGTMTEVLRRAAERQWIIMEWCYKESLQPHGWLDPAEITRKRNEMSTQQWTVEVELQEPSGENRAIDPDAVTACFQEALGIYEGKARESIEAEPPEPGATYAHGADWAKSQDWTELVSLRTDVLPYRIVAYERMQRLPWPVMVGCFDARLIRYAPTQPRRQGEPCLAWHDGTGLGSVVDGYLEQEAESFVMVGRARADLFSNCVAALERGDIVGPFIRALEGQLRYCTVEDLYGTGHPPDGFVALALAYHGATQKAKPAKRIGAWGR